MCSHGHSGPPHAEGWGDGVSHPPAIEGKHQQQLLDDREVGSGILASVLLDALAIVPLSQFCISHPPLVATGAIVNGED